MSICRKELFYLECNQCCTLTFAWETERAAEQAARVDGWIVSHNEGYQLALCLKCSRLPSCPKCNGKAYSMWPDGGPGNDYVPRACEECGGTGKLTICGPECAYVMSGEGGSCCQHFWHLLYEPGKHCREWRPR